jgi:hypothetical protein
MNIIEITELNNLKVYKEFWESCNYHPDCEFSQFVLICKSRSEVASPYVLVVEKDKAPQAILVARLENYQFSPSIGYFKLLKINGKAITVLTDGILGTLNIEVVNLLYQHLWHLLSNGSADAVIFSNLKEDSLFSKFLLEFGPSLWCNKKPKWSAHWMMNVPSTAGQLLREMKSKHRISVLKRKKELESKFPNNVTWRWVKEFKDLNGLCLDLESLASRTYHRALHAGFIDDEEHRNRFALFVERGMLRMQLLLIEGQIGAFWIGVVYKKIFHSIETAYDPNLTKFTPGTLVFLNMIDELAREKVERIDFGLGDADYKRRFGKTSKREATIQVFSPSPKGVTLRTYFYITEILDKMVRKLLQETGILNRIKSVWRKALVRNTAIAKN